MSIGSMNMGAMLSSMQSAAGSGEPGGGILGIFRDVQFAPLLDFGISPMSKPIGGSIIASFIAGGVVNKKLNMKFLNAIKQAAEQISSMNRQQLEQLAQTMRSTGSIAALTPQAATMMSNAGISFDH